MKGSTIIKRGRKFSVSAMKPTERPADLPKLMLEKDGAIDRAIQQSAREAALEDVAAGRLVPVWEDGKVVWKPAAEALAETDAKAKRSRRPRSIA